LHKCKQLQVENEVKKWNFEHLKNALDVSFLLTANQKIIIKKVFSKTNEMGTQTDIMMHYHTNSTSITRTLHLEGAYKAISTFMLNGFQCPLVLFCGKLFPDNLCYELFCYIFIHLSNFPCEL
jgi:S-adenosylmethionine:tRNA-ribosyltransferase-isomerase (queuine synthetase)